MMMIQRRGSRSAAASNRNPRSKTKGITRELRQALLQEIAAGAQAFQVEDLDSAASIHEFQQRVRALEALAAEGVIAIGARATKSNELVVVAVRRIRLTEAGKRHVATGDSKEQAHTPP